MEKTEQECKEIVAKNNAFNLNPDYRGFELKLMQIIDLANKMYYEQREWILIEDRLPDCINILAFTGGLKITLTYIDGVYYTNSGKIWCSQVTHWMPLPSPPKQ